MSTPILATKLYMPPPRPKAVSRPHLIARLNEGLPRKLTLISAPAGFGKTTLVSSWIDDLRLPIVDLRPEAAGFEEILNLKSKIRHRAAWLSLEERDSDPTRFLTYLVAALQTVTPGIGTGVLGVLQSAQPPQESAGREAMLAALLNEITTLPDKVVLVLDDYHLIDAAPPGHTPRGAVDEALTFLVEHLPPQLHLVITTREDPPLPLARWRARGQMTELRAADLRFTAAEAAEFLNQAMGLNLSLAEIAALEERTEGWIAGLQMTALSLQGRAETASFIRAFTGSHHFIIDYLVEEVLQRQPERVRGFLLQTAILDRLSGPLCVAVTGQEESRRMLETLERGNLFVVALDDQRHWYRYHHLFAEVLAAHLLADQPEIVATLHQRASQWYAQHDLLPDAIHHALAAQDFARVADLVELAMPAMRRSRQEAALLGWLQAIPDEVVRGRPVLSVHYAGVLLQCGQLTGVEERLRDAERWLDKPPATGVVVIDQAEFRRLPAWIAIYRAGQALVHGAVSDTLQYAQQALALAPEDDRLGRGAAAALLGLAHWTSGDLAAAQRTYAAGMASVQQAGHLADAIGGVIALAAIQITQGRLREAMRTYERGLQLATAQQHPTAGTLRVQPLLRGTADMYVGMSELHRERNDLQAAMQHLLRSQELGEHMGFPQNPYRWRVAMARIRQAQGDLDGALDLLDEAARLYVSDFFPNVQPVAALKTRLWVAQGRLGEALGWVQEQGLAAHDDLSYLREFEHITLVRVLLACYKRDHGDHALLEATGLLARLLAAAEAGGRTGRVIEILLLQALAHQLQANIAAALAPLERALTLAGGLAGGPTGAEGYVRIFVDEGEAMRLLILDFRFWIAQQPGTAQNAKLIAYADKILAGFGDEPAEVDKPLLVEQAKIANPKSPIQNLIEPLSERELAVLRLFKTELSGPEIARELVVALSTVRTHTKSIYSKLNVNSRRAAVNRAEELGLI